jgi:CheY-like chemotaxis protein
MLVDDDSRVRWGYSSIIHSTGTGNHEITEYGNARSAIASFPNTKILEPYDLVITDFEMGEGGDGVDVARKAIAEKVSAVMILSGYSLASETEKADRLKQVVREGAIYIDKTKLSEFKRILTEELRKISGGTRGKLGKVMGKLIWR